MLKVEHRHSGALHPALLFSFTQKNWIYKRSGIPLSFCQQSAQHQLALHQVAQHHQHQLYPPNRSTTMFCFFRSSRSRVDKQLWKSCLQDIEFNKFINTVVSDSFDIVQKRESVGKWEIPPSLPVEVVLAEVKRQRRIDIKYTISMCNERYYLHMYDPVPMKIWKKEH